MKTILKFAAMLLVLISGCKKEDPLITQEKWIWAQDSLIVTLDLYPTDNKFYSIVEGEISGNSGIKAILFQNDTWLYYKIMGDTMCVRRENENFPSKNDRYNKWLIHQHTEKFLEIEYVGDLPSVPIITHYLFNSQN